VAPVEPLRMKFFLRKPDGSVTPSTLEVSWPEPRPSSEAAKLGMRTLFVTSASFPGILPEGGGSSRRESNLHAMVEILGAVQQFCIDFEKSGGVLYFPKYENDSEPFLGEPVKAKRFFRL
jgi:hypothetical protein